MTRTARRTATAAALAALALAGCRGSSEEAPVGDLGGVWSGTWNGPGATGYAWPVSVGMLELDQSSRRVVGAFRILQGPPFYDQIVYQGSFAGHIVGGTVEFELDAGVGQYRGTGRVRVRDGRTFLDLDYSGVSCCGYPDAASDSLERLDTCPPEHTVCPGPSPSCADLENDDSSCGDCGVVCSAPTSCRRGYCLMPETPACTGPLALRAAAPIEGLPTIAAGYHAKDVALADLNDDGSLDAAVAYDDGHVYEADVVSVLLNDGAGTLQPAGTYALGSVARAGGAPFPVSLAVGDFDGDGAADLACLHVTVDSEGADVASISVFRGAGEGSFGPPAELPAVAAVIPWTWQDALASVDLDGDGRSDLVAANPADGTLLVYLSEAGGFAAPVAHPAPGVANGIVASDLDADGRADVAVGFSYLIDPTTLQYRSGMLVLGGNGDGTLREAVEVAGRCGSAVGDSLFAADFDRDGRTDVLQLDACASLFDGGPDGTFAATHHSFEWYRGGAVADLDGDGNLDVVTAVPETYSGLSTRLPFHRGSGDGSFLPAVASDLDAYYADVASGDLDGDGIDDLLLTSGGWRGGDPQLWVMLACSR